MPVAIMTKSDKPAADIIGALANTPETGNYSADNADGRTLALAVIEHMRATEFPGMLGHVVRSVVESGRYGPLEIGYFAVFAEHAIGA